jgi:hypothetical protein
MRPRSSLNAHAIMILARRPDDRNRSAGCRDSAPGFARFVYDRLSIIALMNLDDVDREAILHGVAALYLR